MKIDIPELCLVVLVGVTGSGKSTFARRCFLPTEVVSSDWCRALVADDETDQSATADAFDLLHYVVAKRLARGRLAVVDATNVQPEARKPLVELARRHHCLPVAIVLDIDPELAQSRNAERPDRRFGEHVVRGQHRQLRRSLRHLEREGFRHVTVLRGPAEIDTAELVRKKLWNDKRGEHGPFDIIGDVHGCIDELRDLLRALGYDDDGVPPPGRRAVFVGDLVDRGPDTPAVLELVMRMVAAGHAYCVPGNHENKLARKLRGKNVRLTHGLERSVEQLAARAPELSVRVLAFIDSLVSHYVFDDGKLVVAHAGLRAELQGRASGRVRELCLYGETTGETDEFGLPVRHDWAAEYRGSAMVVYGHTPVPDAEWLNRTICIDTGCVFGGRLTALRYPERELVQIPARRVYYDPVKPTRAPEPRRDDLLALEDVYGRRVVHTRIGGNYTIREESSAGALEVMSRFAVSPRWLVYLPPTMSPCETAASGDLLERPEEAFAYFQRSGVPRVVCQQKHMGSRAVVTLCRDPDAARRRFGATDRTGVVTTRTGRPFFSDPELERALLARIAAAVGAAGFWDRFATDWICLDAELMPWSAKARELLRAQYAAVGSAAAASFGAALAVLEQAEARGIDGVSALAARTRARQELLHRYVAAYRRYCWPVEGLSGLRLAPFHLLATEGKVHTDRDHAWHIETLAELARHDDLLLATRTQLVDVTDAESLAAGARWWHELTEAGGEGMVVKPLDWIVRRKRGLVQPAVKCRGPEYLRIIYGAEYSAPGNLDRLRARGLGPKRALAIREYALGLEALHRFVEGEPLHRVHECVFAVLALETEPVDPRL